jgi:hypothetical protein
LGRIPLSRSGATGQNRAFVMQFISPGKNPLYAFMQRLIGLGKQMQKTWNWFSFALLIPLKNVWI